MKHLSYKINDIDTLSRILKQDIDPSLGSESASILVQVFSHEDNEHWFLNISKVIQSQFHQAIIVGGNTPASIAHGETVTDETVVGITFFKTSSLQLLTQTCEGMSDFEAGVEISKGIQSVEERIAGLLVMTTPISLDAIQLLSGLKTSHQNYPVFGCGVGDINTQHSILLCHDKIINEGVAVVAFCGTDLNMDVNNYLGWLPLSQEMKVTAVDGLTVTEINHEPAYNIYSKYLDIEADDQFFLNAVEFPLLIKRNSQLIARVPNQVLPDGGLLFSADIFEGEVVQIGYGDHRTIIDNAQYIQNDFTRDPPEAIYLYSCLCRWFLMGQDVVYETLPYEKIAPAFGLYTAGEIHGSNNRIEYLNAAMVVVGLNENKGNTQKVLPKNLDKHVEEVKPHKRLVARLTHFIGTVSKELREANRELEILAVTDKLTGLYNRAKIDKDLVHELSMAERYEHVFSVVLIDIDHFKSINDSFGHLVGDTVLKELAILMEQHTRETDIKGRWGGEEFILILPSTNIEKAINAAEILRNSIAEYEFKTVGSVTASFGVSAYRANDDSDAVVNRADHALYEAKRHGRNRVYSETDP